jgi:tetratricopeptide (TPR) repeat protein
MSVKVASNRFIIPSLHRFGALYQHLFSSVSGFQQLGERLIREAEMAQAFRQIDRLEQLGSLLSHLPLKEYHIIGQYYLGWSQYRKGENAQPIFEKVVEQSRTYKTKGLISLGALMFGNKDFGSAIKCYTEALRNDNSPAVFIPIARTIAVIKATEGNHKQALKDLESIFHLARFTDPKSYYDYLNSYAVELAESGRIEEATNVSNIVLASTYAFAYPEWRETGREIALRGYKSRSVVSVDQPFSELENVIKLPIPEYKSRSVQTKPGRLLNYVEWIKKMVKEPNGNQKDDTSEELDKMTNKDLLVEILQRTSKKDMSDRKLRKILEYVMEVELEPED